jgi:hypothetical protein
MRMYRDELAALRHAFNVEQGELEGLRIEAAHLRDVVAHQDKRLAVIRNNPAYRMYLSAKARRGGDE